MKSGNKPEAGKVKVRIPKPNRISTAQHDATKSPRYYDPQTLKLLWGRAAGRCAMPDCRVELFVTEDNYDPVCVIGEMGHIAASSNAGPRANAEIDLRIRDKYENLILLCRNCHRKVDTLKLSYPHERLFEIKASHEAWVRTALPERGFTHLRWQVLRLQGDFPFDPTTILNSLAELSICCAKKQRRSMCRPFKRCPLIQETTPSVLARSTVELTLLPR